MALTFVFSYTYIFSASLFVPHVKLCCDVLNIKIISIILCLEHVSLLYLSQYAELNFTFICAQNDHGSLRKTLILYHFSESLAHYNIT